jgi:hypothetical protein
MFSDPHPHPVLQQRETTMYFRNIANIYPAYIVSTSDVHGRIFDLAGVFRNSFASMCNNPALS